MIKKLSNYVKSVPFLAKIFTKPTEDKLFDSKVFYDQAKPKNMLPLEYNIFKNGEVSNFFYIYTAEQYLEEWNSDNFLSVTVSLETFDSKQ